MAKRRKIIAFQPYLLREYLNRWYVISLLSDTSEIRTFGLDRIVGLNNSGNKFKKDKKRNIASLFQNVIGINASGHSSTITL